MKILSNRDKKILLWSYRYIKKYKLKLVFVIISIVLLILITTIEPILRAKFISLLFTKDIKKIINILTILSALYFFQLLVNYLKSRLIIKLDNNISNDLKKDMFLRIINLPIKAFDNISIGELMSRMNGDVQALSSIFTNYLLILLSDSLTVLFVGFSMIKLNYTLFLIIAITFPITWVIFKIYGNRLRKQGKMLKEINDKSFTKTQQSFSGIKEIISLGIKKIVVSEMNIILDDMNNKTIDYSVTSMKANILAYAVNSLDRIVFMIIATIFVINNKITVEILIAFLSYSITFSSSLSNLTQMNSIIQQFLVSLERIFDLSNNLSYKNINFGNKEVKDLEGRICLKNVSFSYSTIEDVIKDITLEINGCTKVAIVGKSGSGKSTIFNLLLRLYDNYKGEITIDGVNLRDFTEETIRNNIVSVLQETYLFNTSIKENLSINDSSVSDEEIINICKKCRIHDYIMSLPEGYDTYVTEGGGNFSSGQKQRISIARAILKKAKIILFDEVTSSLDNEAQFAISELIDEVAKDHTVIIIAHRLNTIINSDKIIVMDRGNIVGCGKHKELSKDNKEYRELLLHEKLN